MSLRNSRFAAGFQKIFGGLDSYEGALSAASPYREIPTNSETREVLAANGGSPSWSFINVGGATPTPVDGTDLVAFTTFGITPKNIIATSSSSTDATAFLGWILAINFGSAGAAAVAINAALDTGVAHYNSTPVQNDTDSGLVFVPRLGSVLHTSASAIEDVYCGPLAYSGDTVSDAMLMQLVFKE